MVAHLLCERRGGGGVIEAAYSSHRCCFRKNIECSKSRPTLLGECVRESGRGRCGSSCSRCCNGKKYCGVRARAHLYVYSFSFSPIFFKVSELAS